MTQYDFGTINPSTKSGTDLASDLNDWRDAVHSTHRGTARPTYAVTGMLWNDSDDGKIKYYNGTADDIVLKGAVTAFGTSLAEAADAPAGRTVLELGSSAVADLQDDDTFAAATATDVASSESIKAYVDSSTNSSRISISGGSSLSADNQYTVTDSLTYGLPSVLTADVGSVISVVKYPAQAPVVNAPSSGELVTDDGVVASITLNDDMEYIFVNDGSHWQVTSNTNYGDSNVLSLFSATGAAPVFASRAFVDFDGSGTVTIRTSGNVSSITDNGVGDYTVNFTSAMPDADFTVAGFSGLDAGGTQQPTLVMAIAGTPLARTTTSINIGVGFPSITGTGAEYKDSDQVLVTIFR